MAKISFFEEKTERIHQERGGPSQERHSHWKDEVWDF